MGKQRSTSRWRLVSPLLISNNATADSDSDADEDSNFSGDDGDVELLFLFENITEAWLRSNNESLGINGFWFEIDGSVESIK